MNETWVILIGIGIPFLGTIFGAAMVFFLKDEIQPWGQKLLLGFASGVMMAASVWSLLIPAMELTEQAGGVVWLPVVVGFFAGIVFLLLLDTLIPHLHVISQTEEGKPSHLKKSTMMVLAVTLHNIPEGMAVGVVLSGVTAENSAMTAAGALALAVGIAIQNFPEGALISMPLLGTGIQKAKAFGFGFLSGVVEPLAALLTLLFASAVTSVLPYILAFAAGAMIYVVVEELIPESQSGDHSNVGTIGTALGFALMMVLDIALG